MVKQRYDLKLLNNFCINNNIQLLKNYENEKINRDIQIESKCLTLDCKNIVSKNYVNL